MAKSGRYKVPMRRRREGKTDYRRRLALLKSGKVRLVVRKTNRYIIAQFVEYNPEGDRVLCHAYSKELDRYGWKHSKKNIPAAYLTGYLAGLRAVNKGITSAILDIGRHPSTKESRIYAVLKGALDAGVDIPHGEEILPSEERIRGEHIASYASSLSDEDLKTKFSELLKAGADPRMIPEDFDSVLEKIKVEGGSQK